MPLIPIDMPDDVRLDPYRTVRERDLVGRAGLFVAEGEVVLRTLLGRSRFGVESVLLGRNQAERLGPDLVATRPDLPVYVVERTVMDGVAGFPIHRGILAIGIQGDALAPDALLAESGPKALALGLVGLANHDNVGGIFRNAAAFGVGAILLDGTSCDPLYRKAIRVSVGASLTVPFARADTAESMVASFARAGFEVVALSPEGRETLSEITWLSRTALLLGAEGPGLPAAFLNRVRSVAIPMAAGFDSLNVATSSGIALYEARRGLIRG